MMVDILRKSSDGNRWLPDSWLAVIQVFLLISISYLIFWVIAQVGILKEESADILMKSLATSVLPVAIVVITSIVEGILDVLKEKVISALKIGIFGIIFVAAIVFSPVVAKSSPIGQWLNGLTVIAGGSTVNFGIFSKTATGLFLGLAITLLISKKFLENRDELLQLTMLAFEFLLFFSVFLVVDPDVQRILPPTLMVVVASRAFDLTKPFE